MKLLDYGDRREVKDWRIKTLEWLKSLIEALPQLSKVTWRRGRCRLCLADPEEETSEYVNVPGKHGNLISVHRNRVYQAFNVDEEIKKRTETTKARRNAAAKKALK
jgi:hypothetical protein